MRRLALLASASLLALGACGDDKDPDANPDAPRADAPPVVVDSAPMPDGGDEPCDYIEQSDLTNDTVFGEDPMAEDTGLTLGVDLVVCGSLASTHFADDLIVDVDAYHFSVATATDVLVRLSGPAEAIEYAGIDVYGGPTFGTTLASGTFYGSHGVVALHLEAGTYEVVPFALNSEAIAADVPYMIEISTDVPETRCAALTTGGYAEANDTVTDAGNDAVAFPTSGTSPVLSASPTDAPEPTALTLELTATRVTGSAADVTVADQYEDKDTYLVTTGASTNELTIRVDTTVATANLDVFVFEAGVVPPIFRGASTTAQPETIIVPLKPSAPYWITVAAKVGSTGLPAAYSATLCGASYTQPLGL